MAVCVQVIDGFIKSSNIAIGSCTDYVLITANDFALQNPSVTVDDMSLMTWGVVSVWAFAWGLKVLRRAL